MDKKEEQGKTKASESREIRQGIVGTSARLRYNNRTDPTDKRQTIKRNDDRASDALDYPKIGQTEVPRARKCKRRQTSKEPLDEYVITELGKLVTSFFKLAQSDPLPALKEVTDELKKAVVLRAMELCDGNCHKAARHLRMNRTTLSNIFGDVNPHHKRIMRPGVVVCVNSMAEVPDYVYDEIKKLLINFGY